MLTLMRIIPTQVNLIFTVVNIIVTQRIIILSSVIVKITGVHITSAFANITTTCVHIKATTVNIEPAAVSITIRLKAYDKLRQIKKGTDLNLSPFSIQYIYLSRSLFLHDQELRTSVLSVLFRSTVFFAVNLRFRFTVTFS